MNKEQEKTGKIFIEIVIRHDGSLNDAEAKRLADKAIKKMLSNNRLSGLAFWVIFIIMLIIFYLICFLVK